MKNGITVVLTAFKRIDSLRVQLDSIKNQTLKPQEVWLFQDKISKDYEIQLKEELLEEFDNVCIAQENVGVWGRFEFAKKAKTEYVCIFDDDTIPGNRWLENCMDNMKKNEGIYGAIGVTVFNNNDYPYSNYCRVGWQRPNPETCEVDFVGHSWFLKTEWLTFMFEDAKNMRKYKYAAEDMSVSYAALLHDIKTYVPAHPFDNYEIWGSLPESGTILGQNSVALSGNGNAKRMNDAIKELENMGWNFIYKRNPHYIAYLKKVSNSAHKKIILQKIMRLFKKGHKTY